MDLLVSSPKELCLVVVSYCIIKLETNYVVKFNPVPMCQPLKAAATITILANEYGNYVKTPNVEAQHTQYPL